MVRVDQSIKVDPRARGGDISTVLAVSADNGRSPRTRGRHVKLDTTHIRAGSIPAHAGETADVRAGAPPIGVDPRARGGDCSRAANSSSEAGRSPRTRGRPADPDGGESTFWSIPAHAGETFSFLLRCSLQLVDPRARGGDALGNCEGA